MSFLTTLCLIILCLILGIASSSDIAYNSYLYAIVEKKDFKRVTSYTRTSTMVGKFLAYSLGQLIITMQIGDYLLLNKAYFFFFNLKNTTLLEE